MRARSKKDIIKIKKQNARLYPIYKMFSWDLVFYFAINYLFLLETKGFSPADIMISSSIYPIYKMVLQFPMSFVVEKLNKKKSLVLGNIAVSIYILLLINVNSFSSLLLSYLFCASGFVLKELTTSNLLYDSVTTRNGKGMFSKLEEKGSSYYYIFDGITSMLTGFLFVKNGYLPMYICLIFTVISVVISLFFRDIESPPKSEGKDYFKDIEHSLHFIFNSKRLKALFIYGMIIIGYIDFLFVSKKQILVDIGVPAEYFAMIFSFLVIVTGIVVRNLERIKHKLGRKVLGTTALTLGFTMIAMCLIVLFVESSLFVIITVLIVFLLNYIIQGIVMVLIEEYLKSFVTSKTRIRISTVYNILTCVSRAVFTFVAGLILGVTSTVNTTIIISLVFVIIMIRVLIYMKTRIGLNPKEYDKNDVEVM